QLIRAAVAVTTCNAPGARTEREARRMLELAAELGRAELEWRRALDACLAALDDAIAALGIEDELARWCMSAQAMRRVVEASHAEALWAGRAAGIALARAEGEPAA